MGGCGPFRSYLDIGVRNGNVALLISVMWMFFDNLKLVGEIVLSAEVKFEIMVQEL